MTTVDNEEIEGLDVNQSDGWEDYPLDAVFVRNETRTVGEVVKRIRAGRYQLDPDFQRDFVWEPKKQSRLIESCLMRIPLPVFYVAETKNGVIAVVDGLQRLTTFHRYLDDKFALQLDVPDENSPHPLNRKKFSDLPIHLQERIEDTQLTLYILDSAAPDRAKLDIFERVNNGVPLTRQQMRNCLYNGPATQWLKSMAENTYFLTVTGKSLNAKAMRDREAINRFCAFHLLGEDAYRGDMDKFLALALEKMHEPNTDLVLLQEVFMNSMRINQFLFHDHAFRKSLVKFIGPQKWPDRSILNIALFDVCSVIFANLEYDLIQENVGDVLVAIRELFDDPDFVNSITYSTNSTRQVQTRFSKARNALNKITILFI
jgi:hypothetical protein